jgi:hypothetical protein
MIADSYKPPERDYRKEDRGKKDNRTRGKCLKKKQSDKATERQSRGFMYQAKS